MQTVTASPIKGWWSDQSQCRGCCDCCRRRRSSRRMLTEAIAALIDFQDRYDISCRVEWDYSIQHWKIVANTLGDLTKRENRFCHWGFNVGSGSSNPSVRKFPFQMVSSGGGYSGSSVDVQFVPDPEVGSQNKGQAVANIVNSTVVSYSTDLTKLTDKSLWYTVRPFAFLSKAPVTRRARRRPRRPY